MSFTPNKHRYSEFLRDLAMGLPAFHLRHQRVIVRGEFIAVPLGGVRPSGPLDRVVVDEVRSVATGKAELKNRG